jgi:hypothetical protein
VRGAVAPGRLELQHHLTRGVGLHALVDKRWAGDVVAQLFQPLAVLRFTAHRRVHAETLHIGAQRLVEVRMPGHRALHRQHPLAGPRAESDTAHAGGCLRWPERAGCLRVAVVVSDAGPALLLPQRAVLRRQLHRAGDGLLRRSLRQIVGRHRCLDEHRFTFSATLVHALQH